MQETTGVFVEKALRCGGDVLRRPGPAMRREIQVAFGPAAVEFWC
jgi:hypothetical protein